MKKLIILSIGLLSWQLSAQNIELTILPNSIKVQNDYLYFRYRIQNKSDTAFVLYNAGMVDVAKSKEQDDFSMNANTMGLSGFIYDENGDFRPRTYFAHKSYIPPCVTIERTYEDSISYFFNNKDIILNQGSFVEYDRRLNIGADDIEFNQLEKGTYKIQLKYGFYLDYYRQQYIRSKGITPSLKNTVLFEGEIWSGFYSFEYP